MSAAPRPRIDQQQAWLTLLEQWESPSAWVPENRISVMGALRTQIDLDPSVLDRRESADLRARIQQLAQAIDDLPLAALVGLHRIACGDANIDESIDVSIALWRQGRHDEAFDLCRRLLLMHPRAERAMTVLEDMLAWRRTAWPMRVPDGPWRDGTLRLEPLGHQHIDDFAAAYYDPVIAERCCLPRFNDNASWHRWLDDVLSFGDQMTFGVWHHEWGFVGSVSLLMADDIGFFYYWIARDFQGFGLGPQAAALLFDLAEQAWGMRCCYAKVFDDNTPSQRGLLKLGFTPTQLPIQGENHAELLYRRSAQGDTTASNPDPDTAALEARALFDAMGSRIRVLRPIAHSTAFRRFST